MKIHTEYQSYGGKSRAGGAQLVAGVDRTAERGRQAVMLDPEADPVEVYRFWLLNQTHGLREQIDLRQGSIEYLASMRRSCRHPAYVQHVDRALRAFRSEVGNCQLSRLTVTQLREHLFGLPFSALTIDHRRTYLLTAFKWWKTQGWVTDNPVAKVERPVVVEQEPGILTVAETLKLFRANEKVDPEICGLLAFGAFAGMRSSAISRIDYSEIDFAQRGILTPAEKTKKKRRQWIEDLPDNLWAWLKKTPPQAFEMTHRQMLHRKSQAFRRAGLLVEGYEINRINGRREARGEPLLDLKPKCPPKNALRHSFVTYHVALHRNPGKTALIVSHRDQDCLYRHYLGIANQKDAKEYFAIRPRQ